MDQTKCCQLMRQYSQRRSIPAQIVSDGWSRDWSGTSSPRHSDGIVTYLQQTDYPSHVALSTPQNLPLLSSSYPLGRPLTILFMFTRM